MNTKLSIINAALMKVGLPLAADLSDCDWNAGSIYDAVAEQVLRSFPWGFATRFAVLARDIADPAFGFRHAYAMPPDCLRVVDVRCGEDLRSPRARFVVSGKLIYANVSPCNARYVARDKDPANWPTDFADAVAARIAAEIANLSAQTMSMTPNLIQLYQLSLAQAQAVDATETTERVPLDESILAARAGNGARS